MFFHSCRAKKLFEQSRNGGPMGNLLLCHSTASDVASQFAASPGLIPYSIHFSVKHCLHSILPLVTDLRCSNAYLIVEII